MRMRQSLADLESAFVESAQESQADVERRLRETDRRKHQRQLKAQRRRGSLRFLGLVLTLVATAVVVTLVMFETLAYVMG
jgi:anti-sigma-K factor RskA